MANAMFLWPNYGDVGVTYTPSFSGGSWPAALPLTNLQDRRLHRVARSLSARAEDTRFRCDLGVDRDIRGVVLPKSNFSTAAEWRVIGVPSTLLLDYEAGQDIAALGGTFSRAPSAGTLAATYVDHNGLVQYAGENRVLQSEVFGTTWSASNVTVTSNTVASPFGATTADTLTATSGNGTVTQAVTTVAVTYTFSVWLKRLTGSGNVDISLDGTTWVTKTLTTDWQRFSVSQTGVAGTSNPGIRLVTSGNAVYAWGAQVEIGSTAKSYLTTTAAAVSALRDGHYPVIRGVRTVLTEAASTNLCLQSEDLGTTWAAVGSPSRSAAAGTCGVVNLDLIGDDDGAALEGYTQTITFTGNATKAVSLFIRQGTSTSTMIRLRDTSAGADRLLVAITWSGGLPVLTPTTGSALGYRQLADASGNAVFWVWLLTSSVTAANTNSLQVYPASNAALATSATGTVYIGGVQAENATAPSAYIKTTTATVTRALDSLYFTFAAVPQAMTGYLKFYHGTAVVNGARLFQIGLTTATTDPRFSVMTQAAGRYESMHDNGVDAAVTSTLSTGPSVGQLTEIRAVLNADGSTQLHQSLASAAETSASASSAPASGLQGAWAGTRIYINGDPADGNTGCSAFASIRFEAGVETLATMQGIVSDSGWIDAWPAGIDAEEAAGMSIPAVHLLPAAFSARYWSVQLRDPTNVAGYLDISRLLIAAGFQPATNFSYGAALGVETMTTRERTNSGVAYYDDQPRFRSFDFELGTLTESEGMVNVLDFMRIAGIHQQFFFVFNPDDTTHMHRRSFLATLERLSALQFPYLTVGRVALRAIEEL